MAGYLDPYIVIGTGRSGTSTVSRILHEKLNVNMSPPFVPESDQTPGGSYESLLFRNMIKKLYTGQETFDNWYAQLTEIFYNLSLRAQSNKQYWGIKSVLSNIICGLYFQFAEDPKFIWCIRDKDICTASMTKWWYKDPTISESQYDRTMIAMERTLKGKDYLLIHFGRKHKTDEEIIERITNRWKNLTPKP